MIKIILYAVLLGPLWIGSGVANAGLINANVWYQFSFDTSASVFAMGCNPADASGLVCAPSTGTPSVFADAPPWTFTVGVNGATLVLTDAFLAGDRFEVFNFGSTLGATPTVAPFDNILNPVDCGDDPKVCLTTPGISHASFLLGAGSYSLTISALDAPFGAGTGHFFVNSVNVNGIPNPGTLALTIPGLLWIGLVSRKRIEQRLFLGSFVGSGQSAKFG